MYAVFKFKKGAKEIEALYKDDAIARQTLIKRDGKSLGMDDATFLIVEGSEDAVMKAKAIAEASLMKEDEAKKVYKKIKEDEESASMGMGAIFG